METTIVKDMNSFKAVSSIDGFYGNREGSFNIKLTTKSYGRSSIRESITITSPDEAFVPPHYREITSMWKESKKTKKVIKKYHDDALKNLKREMNLFIDYMNRFGV